MSLHHQGAIWIRWIDDFGDTGGEEAIAGGGGGRWLADFGLGDGGDGVLEKNFWWAPPRDGMTEVEAGLAQAVRVNGAPPPRGRAHELRECDDDVVKKLESVRR